MLTICYFCFIYFILIFIGVFFFFYHCFHINFYLLMLLCNKVDLVSWFETWPLISWDEELAEQWTQEAAVKDKLTETGRMWRFCSSCCFIAARRAELLRCIVVCCVFPVTNSSNPQPGLPQAPAVATKFSSSFFFWLSTNASREAKKRK